MCGEFRAVVSGYGLDVFLVGQQQTSDRFGRRLGLLSMGKFGHEEHVCGTLHDCEYGVVVTVHNQIHLPPKAFPIHLLGTRMNARSIGYEETLVLGSAPIFELVAGGARQFSGCVGMDQVVDALMYRSSGLRTPAARPTRGVFHRLDPMKKRMICCTSILKVRQQ